MFVQPGEGADFQLEVDMRPDPVGGRADRFTVMQSVFSCVSEVLPLCVASECGLGFTMGSSTEEDNENNTIVRGTFACNTPCTNPSLARIALDVFVLRHTRKN